MSCFTDAQTYVGCTAGAGNPSAVSGTSVDGFTVTATSASTNTFTITRNANGTYTRSCVANNTGAGCPTSLSW